MNQEEFDDYIKHVTEIYVEDLKRYKDQLDQDPYEMAEQEIEEMIPQGVQTPYNYICKIKDDDKGIEIGHIWYIYNPNNDKNKQCAFLADIFIKKDYRGKGYGTKALKMLEKRVKSMKASKIILHVFKHNDRARKLYKKLGYKIKEEVNTGYRMLKQL